MESRPWSFAAALMAASAIATSAAAAAPEAGDIQIKAMATMVDVDGGITSVVRDRIPLPARADTKADTAYVPTVAAEYFVTPNISVETYCCVSRHDVTGTGSIKGARLIGAFQVNETTDRLILQFSQMTLPDGSSVAVNAYAVDPVTAQTSVASDVDRRWLERYGPLIAASFVTGFSEAVATAGSTVTVLTEGVTSTQGEPDTTESLFAGVAKAGQAIANNIASSAPTGPLVMLESGFPVGVLFIAPVTRASR